MQYELSYWERETLLKGIDVAVIGSGLVGLSAAIRLKQRQPALKVVVVERGGLPIGASTRNAGFACFGSVTELLDDMTTMPANEVWNTVERRWKGLANLRTMLGDLPIDFRQLGGYEMFTEADQPVYEQCLQHLDEFNRMAADITGQPQVYQIADAHLPQFGFNGVRHLLLNSAEGQIHTGQMMVALLALARTHEVEILNGLPITAIQDTGKGIQLDTAAGWPLMAQQALVCTNGFARQLLPDLPVVPARNQVLITQPIPNLPFEGCFHYDRGYYYFRNIDGRILLGGGRNLDLETEQTDQFGANNTIRESLLHLLQTVICPRTTLEIDTWWTGILGLGPVKKPIIEQVSPHITVAVRMSGMGVAIGSLVGRDGADMVIENG